jgi:predicted component of type VI protein secretion system
MIRVTVSRAGESPRQLTLAKSELIVGRGGEADVQLRTEAVSRRHARLTRTDEGWQVADLGAANGVFVQREGGEPERIVFHLLRPKDRIHIEAFVIELEEAQDVPFTAVSDERDDVGPETALERQRTQFISMVDVLAAREMALAQGPATNSGPIMKVVSGEDAALGLLSTGPLPAAASLAAASFPAAEPAWYARMTSPSGHDRHFKLTTATVQVGSSETCAVRLPTGPGVILELERASDEVFFRRVPFWPFPRVLVGGRTQKSGSLSDGESFLVGEYEVSVYLASAP